MEENKEGEEPASRGNEWEVVSLTASAYAASPGSGSVEANVYDKKHASEEDAAETSNALFMSRHFVFPPSQHENLPMEPQVGDIEKEKKDQDDASDLNMEEGGISESDTKGKEDWNIKGFNLHDEFPGLEFIDEKQKKTSLLDAGFESSLHDKEQNLFDAANFSSFCREPIVGESTAYEMNTMEIPEIVEHFDEGFDIATDIATSPKLKKEEIYDGSDLPCQAWWKRRAGSLYAHAKEANTFWSIFIAAAVMGLVILGQQWQQERWQVLQLKWQFTVSEEKMGKLTVPLSRLKDVIVGGHRRGSFIRGRSSGEL